MEETQNRKVKIWSEFVGEAAFYYILFKNPLAHADVA